MTERAVVTDTHALLYYAAGGRTLGAKAAACFAAAERGQGIVYVPIAVAMEIVFLARAGRGGLRVRPKELFGALFVNPAFQPVELTIEQVAAAEDLRFNCDPYDALIVAAAQSLDLPLMTRDAAITDSGLVRVVW